MHTDVVHWRFPARIFQGRIFPVQERFRDRDEERMEEGIQLCLLATSLCHLKQKCIELTL